MAVYHSMLAATVSLVPTCTNCFLASTSRSPLPGAFPANRFSNYMTSATSVDISLKHREMVILGTQYAGEMKKGVFR